MMMVGFCGRRLLLATVGLAAVMAWAQLPTGQGGGGALLPPPPLSPPHIPHLSVQLAGGEPDFDATDVLLVFGNLSRAQAARLQGPTGGSYALQEKRGLLGSLDLLPTADTGDVACQGSLNTERLVVLGDESSLQLAQKWLLTVPLDADGRVWDSSGQQYHQKRQGAWESAAEWILMARLYAAHSGDAAIFKEQAPERILCWEGADGKLHNAGVAAAGSDAICALTQGEILAQFANKPGTGQVITTEGYSDYFKTVDAGPRKIVAAARRLVQRMTIRSGSGGALALHLPLVLHNRPSNTTYPAALCVKHVASGAVVFRTTLFGPQSGEYEIVRKDWIKVKLSSALEPGQYDVALTAAHQATPCRHANQHCTPAVDSAGFSAKWLTVAAPAEVSGKPVIGGARIETWAYEHQGVNGSSDDTDNSCCAQEFEAGANTLAAKLERGMRWQLGLARRAGGREGYGVLAVPDAFFDGVPAVGRGTSSASSMWDQIRMGWKSAYINLLFLASIEAWIELEEAGLVSTTAFDSALVHQQVKADIEKQLMKSDGTMYSWIACNETTAAGSRLSCDRDAAPGPGAHWPKSEGGQSIVDTQMLPDQAWAVRLGVGGAKAQERLREMITAASVSGLVRNNLIPQESVDPRIVSSADKWDPVDERGYCQPTPTGNMSYAGHCVCSSKSSVVGTACWGNFGNNQQNGGRIFATMGTVFQAFPFSTSFQMFRRNVENLRAIAKQLNTNDTSQPLLATHRHYLRKSTTSDVPAGVPAGAIRNMCVLMHHGLAAVADKDAWGEDLCSHYKDITFGLRTGPKNMLQGFALGTLGLRVTAAGRLSLFGTPVPAAAKNNESASVWTGSVSLPSTVEQHWPTGVVGLYLAGLNIGKHRGVSVRCVRASRDLQCHVNWGVPPNSTAADAVSLKTEDENGRCDSRREEGVAIKSIAGANLPTLDLATADACEQHCCASTQCTSWCFTPITRSGGCAKHGCCFRKSGTQAATKQHTVSFQNFTAGCINFTCAKPNSPPTPPPSLPFPYVTPVFKPFGSSFANNSLDALRDPTTAIWAPERGGHWHIYCSSMVCRGAPPHSCGAGYPARIRHFSTPGTLAGGPTAHRSAVWTDEGLVIEPDYHASPPEWDSTGTFTPGVVKECSSSSQEKGEGATGTTCKFYLFFGGVANETGSHTESVGVAIADSAWGPFHKYAHNPVFSMCLRGTIWRYHRISWTDGYLSTFLRSGCLINYVCHGAGGA